MARKAFFVVGVLSLILVGTTGAAQAETERDGVYELFGMTYCTEEAPAEARCDWRIGEPAERPDQPPLAVELFGLTICFDEPATGAEQCTIELPAIREKEGDRQARL